MKNILFLTWLMLISISLSSQSALDAKNGFKDFTLGDKFNKWSSTLVYSHKIESGIKIYTYKGTCCRTLYGYSIAEIRLGFDEDNSLTVIWFSTEKFQKGYEIDGKYTEWNGTKDFDKIQDNIESQFGKADDVETDDNSGKATLYWFGTKVILSLEYEYLGIKNGDRCNILVGKIDPAQSKDGF